MAWAGGGARTFTEVVRSFGYIPTKLITVKILHLSPMFPSHLSQLLPCHLSRPFYSHIYLQIPAQIYS